MGYTTTFNGSLKFTKELSAKELAYLSQFINGTTIQPEWINPQNIRGYMQFELTKDFDGIKWDGSEKFYDSVECVNIIIDNMKAQFPDFGLEGYLECQGEDYADIWMLAIADGKAVEKKTPRIGEEITCPRCGDNFILEGKND